MSATYTFDIFSSLDGFGSHTGDWGGYWGKQGPEFLAHRLEQYNQDQRMVVGGETHRLNTVLLAGDSEAFDPWVRRMRELPTTVISSRLQDSPGVTVVGGDAVEAVRRLKEGSDVPLRSHGSLTLNRALLAAGMVDRIQLTVFPVITGQTGVQPIFGGGPDLDLELLESRTLDGNTQELMYRPRLRA